MISTIGLTNKTYNTYYLIDKLIDSTGNLNNSIVPSKYTLTISCIVFLLFFFQSGASDSTGTLKSLLSDLLFTQTQLLNGNFTEMTPGLLDVSTNKRKV